MKTAIFHFYFFGEEHNIKVPLKDIDTSYYDEFWTYWSEFSQTIEAESNNETIWVKVWFDCEITADKDSTCENKISFENAYINIYQKGEDKLIDTISLTMYDITITEK